MERIFKVALSCRWIKWKIEVADEDVNDDDNDDDIAIIFRIESYLY